MPESVSKFAATHPARTILLAAMTGLGIFYLIHLAVPSAYFSRAYIGVDLTNRALLFKGRTDLLSRKTLEAIIQELKLFPEEQKRLPLEAVVQETHRRLRVVRSPSFGSPSSIRLLFNYPDRAAAEQALRRMDASVIAEARASQVTITEEAPGVLKIAGAAAVDPVAFNACVKELRARLPNEPLLRSKLATLGVDFNGVRVSPTLLPDVIDVSVSGPDASQIQAAAQEAVATVVQAPPVPRFWVIQGAGPPLQSEGLDPISTSCIGLALGGLAGTLFVRHTRSIA